MVPSGNGTATRSPATAFVSGTISAAAMPAVRVYNTNAFCGTVVTHPARGDSTFLRNARQLARYGSVLSVVCT